MNCIKTGLPDGRQLVLEGIQQTVSSVHLLNETCPIPYEIEPDAMTLDLSGVPVDPVSTIVVLDQQ